MSALNDEVRAFLATAPLAHVVTLNADGSPQVSVVWVGVEGDEIVSGHMANHRKLYNVRRDPRVAISFQPTDIPPGTFMADYLVVHGRGRVTEGGAFDLLQRLGKVYVAPEFDFPEQPGPGWVLRVSPERVLGKGPWA
jgi:PPOX class probable F420-dependent enzyme